MKRRIPSCRGEALGYEVGNHLHIMPRFTMSGTILPLAYTDLALPFLNTGNTSYLASLTVNLLLMET